MPNVAKLVAHCEAQAVHTALANVWRHNEADVGIAWDDDVQAYCICVTFDDLPPHETAHALASRVFTRLRESLPHLRHRVEVGIYDEQ